MFDVMWHFMSYNVILKGQYFAFIALFLNIIIIIIIYFKHTSHFSLFFSLLKGGVGSLSLVLLGRNHKITFQHIVIEVVLKNTRHLQVSLALYSDCDGTFSHSIGCFMLRFLATGDVTMSWLPVEVSDVHLAALRSDQASAENADFLVHLDEVCLFWLQWSELQRLPKKSWKKVTNI